jgi:2-polyprenyl-6-methoxyphenol hydroxylase-like FAD-dependent oxidoreductase
VFDTIIVGARCAGASAALLLAALGYRVLLLDGARFPADTMSTLYIHQPGVERLHRWGVLDSVTASGCPKLDRVSYRLGDIVLQGRAMALGGADAGYAPRRKILDQLLVDQAVAGGADFRDGCRVVDLLRDGDRVTGVKYRDATGAVFGETAPLVVGADGMRSTVARLAGATLTSSDPVGTCVYYSLWHEPPGGVEFHEREGGYVAAIPTHDDTTLVATYFPQSKFPEIRVNALEAHLREIRITAPPLFERLRAAQRFDILHGTGDQQNFFRRPSGSGWALIGDAGHHKDSITARGITDALIQAELLSDSIGADLRDRHLLDAALRRFGDRRDAVLAEPYRNALTMAKLTVTERRAAMLRAISMSPKLTDLYFGVIAGVLTADELLIPELLEAL